MNEINKKMIVKVLPAEGSNPEFAPDAELQRGIECHGYMLLTFNEEHELETALIQNLSQKNICDAIVSNCNEEVISTIRQAMAVAEGFMRAANIQMDYTREKAMQRFKKMVNGIDPDGEYMDEFPEDEIQQFPDEEGE